MYIARYSYFTANIAQVEKKTSIGITYGVGKTAKAYFESDMTMDISELKQKFLEGEREAKKREWKGIEED